MKKYRFLFLLAAVVLASCLFVSCADIEPIQACLAGRRYGFLYGLLHGFITPISFVTSLFRDDVAVYAVNNSGGLYDLGFLLGSSGWGFLAGNRSRRQARM